MKITHVLIFAALLALTCAQKAQLILDTDPKEQLLTACQTGEKTEVVMALTNGADINAKDMVSHLLLILLSSFPDIHPTRATCLLTMCCCDRAI